MSNFTDQFMNEADRRGSGDVVRSMLDSGMLMVIDVSSGDTLGDQAKAIPAGPRAIGEIARDIMASPWYRSNASIYARDYIQAMRYLTGIEDSFGLDSAYSVINYALANMTTFRGDLARSVKLELKAHLKGSK